MAKRICSVDECDREARSIGLCGMHYQRHLKGKGVGGAAPKQVRAPAAVRFWSRVDKNGPNGCWLWTGARSVHGYGKFQRGDKTVLAYYFAYENTVGPVPPGMELDHLCINPPCVNPAHLEPVTHQENMRRGPSNVAGRNAAKTHCPQGHPYDEENTMFRANGNRVCRACNNVRSRAAWMKRTGRA